MAQDPCEDFYEFACGGWLRNNPIPEGKSNWGIFSKIELQNQLTIRYALGKEFSWCWNGKLRFHQWFKVGVCVNHVMLVKLLGCLLGRELSQQAQRHLNTDISLTRFQRVGFLRTS